MDPLRFLLAAVLLSGLVGCTDDRRRPTAGPGCGVGQVCGVQPTGGHGTSGAGGSDGGTGAGGAAGFDLSGTVRVLTEPTFSESALYTGLATVSAPKAGGGVVSTKVGGTAGPAFTLEDAQTGSVWVLAHIDEPGPEILSGYSVQHVPASEVQLPVVDRAVLTNIALTLPGQPALEDGKAHVSIVLEQMNLPFEGVEVVGGEAGALVLYDTDVAGGYTDQASGTGQAGRILLLNAAPPANETITVSIQDAAGTPLPSLQIAVAADTVTVVGFDL